MSMDYYKSWLLGLGMCCMGVGEGLAQSDTEFWFVAPEVAASHGDLPVRIGISTYEQAATVKVSMPANSLFPDLQFEVPAFTLEEQDLSLYQRILENYPPNQVLDRGLLIESDVPISAYYHVARRNNQDIYALKGKNALGTEFFIPSQFRFPNIHGEAAVDMVTTQDNTTLTIFPSNSLRGVNGRDPINVTLNRGETYSIRAAGMLPAARLQGTRIVSDKPIAVTNSDDSILNILETGWDLTGDQLVPVEVLGLEYIVVQGDGATEQVYLVATEDNTQITYFNPVEANLTLNEGQSSILEFTSNAIYLESDKPVYVWHLSGVNNEAGAALIPPITCTGNQRVNFMRPIDQQFEMILLTQAEHVDNFVLDDNSSPQYRGLFTQFRPVPGTNNEWMSAKVDASFLQIGFHQLVNTSGLFHLGTLAFPGTGGGSSYGYFSDYNSLNLGQDLTFCAGDSLLLDGGPDRLSYEWQDGSSERTFDVTQSGTYWVKTRILGGCELVDTVTVESISLQAELGPDTTLCEGEEMRLSVANPSATYQWQDGSIGPQFIVQEPGRYQVDVMRDECRLTDSLNVDYIFFPPLELGADTFICEGDNLLLDAGEDSTRWRFEWEDGSTSPERLIDTSGIYSVELQIASCISSDQIAVEEIILRASLGADSTLCEGDSLLLLVTNSQAEYIWQDNSRSDQFLVTGPGTYYVTVQRELCRVGDTVNLDYIDVPTLDLGPDTLLCENEQIMLDVFFPEAGYLWQDGSTEASIEVNRDGWYVVERDYLGCLRTDSLFVIPTIPVIDLRPDTTICLTDSVRLFTNPRKASITWEDGSTANERFVMESGTYSVTATNRCASAQESMALTVEDCTCQLFLPNVFSPNGDGSNESFFPEFDCDLQAYSIEIYNRWGQRVYSSENAQIGWEGRDDSGHEVKEGVYFFQLFYRGADRWNQRDVQRRGHLTLLR